MKISVVTVCYNAADSIEQTILSVINQTYNAVEYIIIDGGSTDGTVDIIRKYSDKIAYWVSESDKGIYDAMNKGIKMAHGEWINFMNAGDLFYNELVIESIFQSRKYTSFDVIYGCTICIYHWGKYIVKPAKLSLLKMKMPFCHQSTFTRIEKIKLFNLDFKIAADYDFFYDRYIQSPRRFYYYTDIVAVYDACTGVSSVNVDQLQDDHRIISNVDDTTFLRLIKNIAINRLPVNLKNIIYFVYLFFHPRYKRVKG